MLEAGKATVLREGKDQIHGRKNYVRISPADFEKAYANREFFIGNHKASLGGIWLKVRVANNTSVASYSIQRAATAMIEEFSGRASP